MQKNPATITVILTIAIVGLVLWRNYGVIAVGQSINPDNKKTREEKELSKAITKVGEINVGQVIKTSFGIYEYTEAGWVKKGEVWSILTQ